MSQGLQIFDPNGNVVLDTTDYIVKPFSTINISTAANGSQVDPGMAGAINAFAGFNNTGDGGSGTSLEPTITIGSDGTITWTYDPNVLAYGYGATGFIYYGTY